ncbi:MAG TPA: hypothetical protein VM432_04545, partial [Bdellovibrionales bacterium]|nr:hypothetical protein [Bdellovibrionales bacterium]
MKFRAGPAAFVMALICWGLAAYFAKSAPEMRYLPRVVSGFLAKISSRPIERNEIENIDFKGIERIRLRARAADLKIRGGGDGS